VIASFDPGAFVLTDGSSDEAIAPVEFDEGGTGGDPPPPPEGDGGDPPPPPEGDGGDVPPPPEGDGGDQPPPPEGGDQPPPPEGDGGDQPPPPEGDGGDVPPPPEGDGGDQPPPPPEGFEAFPPDFEFTDEFQEFVDGSFTGDEPLKFEEIPFDEYFQEHALDELYSDLPPDYKEQYFGEFAFGDVPPPPEGFPEFPPPPDFMGTDGEFVPFEFDPNAPPPEGMPPEFFEFDVKRAELEAFLGEFKFEGSPGDIDFEALAEFLPDGFLPPEDVLALFDGFGDDHPLIGEDGSVNPELEGAFHERPPVPEGFDGFDFEGDCPQFDDLITVYDEKNVDETMRGQVNTTRTEELPDGCVVSCSDTTLIETVLGESIPLLSVAPGIFETQWTVKVRQITTTVFKKVAPDGGEETFKVTHEIVGLVLWTVVMEEVDTDGDGEPEQMHVHGTSDYEILSSETTGEAPEGLGAPPEMILPYEYDATMDLAGEA
jgi:hypothetical protein